MAHHTLVPHPDHPPLAATGIVVDVSHDGDEIALEYRVAGAGRLVVPEPATPARTDGLWGTTCFELFLKPAGGDAYVEFNFSPSGRWAAYAFDDHRTGMRDLHFDPPTVERIGDALLASLRHPRLVPESTGRHAPPTAAHADGRTPAQWRGDGGTWRMALAAVIEEAGGRRSFWSLAHPPGAPDFHHDACFAATLPAPRGA